MRLLHTSDWHLGRSLHREDLLGAQGTFIDFLVELVRAERIDAVLVSGDLYDRALPPVDAVRLCDDALRRLAATGARTVVISGNHDSARRLGFGADLIDSAGVHLRTDPRRVAEPVLLHDPNGPVAVYGVPYLEPDAVRADLACDGRGHAAVMGAAMTQVRSDLGRRPVGTRSVVLAHAFVSGGAGCDSERDISVGGASIVPACLFEGISYTALGHLHGAQQVAPAVRYSGSPLAYSFSEEYHRKSVAIVDLESSGSRRPPEAPRVELVPCPVPRLLRRLRGRLADLLADPKLAECENAWVAATLTDAVRPRAAMDQLRARFPHTLQLGFEPEGGARADRTSYSLRLRGRTDLQVAEEFVTHVRHLAPTAGESLLLRDALEAGRAVAVGAQ